MQLQQCHNQNSSQKQDNEQLLRQQNKLNQEINRLKAQIQFVKNQEETAQLEKYEEKMSNTLREVERLNGIIHILQKEKD